MSHDQYSSPLSERYASKAMLELWSPRTRHGLWRELWLALATAERELGLDIPEKGLKEMREHLADIDFDAVAKYEKKFRHDVMAHIHAFGDVAPAAKGIIHLGATSAYVTDNADLIMMRRGLGLLRAKAIRVMRALARFAKQWRDEPTLGSTHLQPAQPTTVGKRATLWIQDLLLDIEEIDYRLATLRFRGVKGTTGTQASFLELFEGDHAKVEQLDADVSKRMGFEQTFAVSGQTYTRKLDYQVHATVAGVAISVSKIGHDLRLLAHLREVEEPFEEEQIGSSAMPYKRNPMRAERMCALSRHVIVLAQDPAFTAATQWLERTLDDSANRRVSTPDAFLSLDGCLVLLENVAKGLVVNPEVIRKNLAEHLPFMAVETILMHAVSRGGDRQQLHERLRRHSIEAAQRMKEGAEVDLLEGIAADRAFGLSRADLDRLADAAQFVGRAPEQVARFLEEQVGPVLSAKRERTPRVAEAALHV
jgi:adenylosuccinate lyase